jgi:hypothetical protein
MLAISERSVLLLINPDSGRLAGLPTEFRSRIEMNRVLLRHFAQVSQVSIRLLGNQPSRAIAADHGSSASKRP